MKESKTQYQVDLPIIDINRNEITRGNHHKGTLKRANDLDGATWTRYSISIWNDIRKTKEELDLGHPAIFPIALVSRLIRCFTKEEEKVILDPFVGVGSTAIAAEGLGKIGIGLEMQKPRKDHVFKICLVEVN